MTTLALIHSTEGENVSAFKDAQVSLIREGLVTLTGNHSLAIVLNQLLYWTQRTKDFHLMLEEERKGSKKVNASHQHGWIYKTATDLIQETMLTISHTTMRVYLKQLIAQEWLEERKHPDNRWNKTTQYRLNLQKLQRELLAVGKTLPDVYLKAFSWRLSKKNNQLKETSETVSSTQKSSNGENLPSDARNLHSNAGILPSDAENLHSNTETTTKNTTEITSKKHRAGHAGECEDKGQGDLAFRC